MFWKTCAPPRREAHFGQNRPPTARESRGRATFFAVPAKEAHKGPPKADQRPIALNAVFFQNRTEILDNFPKFWTNFGPAGNGSKCIFVQKSEKLQKMCTLFSKSERFVSTRSKSYTPGRAGNGKHVHAETCVSTRLIRRVFFVFDWPVLSNEAPKNQTPQGGTTRQPPTTQQQAHPTRPFQNTKKNGTQPTKKEQRAAQKHTKARIRSAVHRRPKKLQETAASHAKQLQGGQKQQITTLRWPEEGGS